MSSSVPDDDAAARADAAAHAQAQGQPSEEELRAAYEAEMSRITSTDMILQSAVSLLNIGGYRLGLAGPAPAGSGGEGAQQSGGGRDLEQVCDAIDSVRALLPILERRRPGELRPLRDALSQLQMVYAREAGAAAPTPESSSGAPAQSQSQSRPQDPGATPATPAGERKPGQPGPAESSGRLWVPGR
jgi:hypothetical protein